MAPRFCLTNLPLRIIFGSDLELRLALATSPSSQQLRGCDHVVTASRCQSGWNALERKEAHGYG
jgi:hypothetical protein